MKNRVFHLISNTHWDREWRFPFERNRQMLVDMIDSVLTILESSPEYRAFHLDSQSIVVRDYLEIKPHNRERLVGLVRENRLLIGPWYILPEQFQVGGENLIRNLLLGHRVSSEHGGVSKIGYTPFSWGQISQLPQIYREFGIDLIMFYRGVNSLESPRAEFVWEGADGTRSIASRFSAMPRYNFYFYVYRPVVHNEGVRDLEYRWTRGGTPFHFADREQSGEDYAVIAPRTEYDADRVVPQVNALINDQAGDFTTNHVIWMEGHDSSGPNTATLDILRDIRRLMPRVNVLHSTLSEYAQSLLASVDPGTLAVVRGERRSTQFDSRSGNLYGYTTSARMFLKQINFDAERWIQFYAEPFSGFSGLLGRDTKERYLDIAWELLIQNSAHDSIGGCSMDEVHEDMLTRYRHAVEIAIGTFDRSVKYVVGRLDLSDFPRSDGDPSRDIFLSAFNPNNATRSGVVEAAIDIPKELDMGSFTVTDPRGETSHVHILDRTDVQPVVEQMIDRPMYLSMRRYRALLELSSIPPFGYSTWKITPSAPAREKAPPLCRLRRGLPILENDRLQVRVRANGTFDVLYKSTGHDFRGQGFFYDEGEAGHAWVHEPLKPFVNTLKAKPRIRVIENGPLRATCRIDYTMTHPANLAARRKRTRRQVRVPMTVFLTLARGAGRVDIRVDIKNTAESHRLRLLFPVGLNFTHSSGEGQFDVVDRPVRRPDTRGWVEQPMYDYPMHQFVDCSDGKNGVAILVNGLKEYEVLPDRKKTLAITLLRSFENIISPSSRQDYSHRKGSQCLGPQSCELAFYPHSGGWLDGHVYEEAFDFNNSIRLVQFGRTGGTLPCRAAFLEINPPELVFSAWKPSETREPGVQILRLYNPTDDTITGTVRSYFAIHTAERVTLEEKPVGAITLTDRFSFPVSLERKTIRTIRLQFQPEA